MPMRFAYSNEQEKYIGGESMPNIGLDHFHQHEAEEVREVLWKLKAENADVHFEEINPDELTDADLRIAFKYFHGRITQEEYDKYVKINFPDRLIAKKTTACRKREITEEAYHEHFKKVFPESRCAFAAWIGNRIAENIGWKEWVARVQNYPQ